MTDRQKRILQSAYEDGHRCGVKGLGLKSRGRYDYASWDRLMRRSAAWAKLSMREKAGYLGPEFEDSWRDGIQDGYEKRRWHREGAQFTAEAMNNGWC